MPGGRNTGADRCDDQEIDDAVAAKETKSFRCNCMKPVPSQPIEWCPSPCSHIGWERPLAQSRGLSRAAGHLEGAEAVRRTVKASKQLGIRY